MRNVTQVALIAVLMLGLRLAVQPVMSKASDWDKKLEKGYYELSIGNVERAIRFFQEKVKAHPDSGACHTALGLALKKHGRLQEAKAEFAAATAAEPGFANGFYELGSMQEGDKEYAAAAQSFERFLKLSGDTTRKAVDGERLRFCKEHM